jgi:transcriptional regulator with XRE-family HTH domain
MEIGLLVREAKMDKLTLGDRIKETRKAQRLTQDQLAERLDVSVEFIGQIERGLKLPSINVFIKIIEALNVSADYLLRDSVSTGQLFGENAIGRKIEKLTPKQRIALEALIETYIQYLN